MLRPSLILPVLVLALFLVCPVGALAGGGQGQPGGHLVAFLDAERIDLGQVGYYHCHDVEGPVIRCFETETERDVAALAGLAERALGGQTHTLESASLLGTVSVTYVLWYEHSSYLGASYFATVPISNLGTFGWSNRISSFKSTNGGSPTWWDLTAYSGSSWDWPASAWVSYVGGDANDRFTSVQVP
jgi:hypothetical protein